MKAQELRIGNLVDSGAMSWGIMKVESILSSANRAYLHTLDSEYLADFLLTSIDPIPITEEWLLKLGFNSVGSFYLELKIENWGIHFSLRYKKLTIEADGCYDENGTFDITEKVKYVHQLQNLYFALTGEELTIKQDAEKATT